MDVKAILMGVAFAVMWSSAFTSARIIVADAAPLWILAFRFCLSGAIGIALGAWMGGSLRLTRSQWIAVAVFGICQNALYLGLNFVAMQTVPASLAAIIASTLPLLVALSGWLIFGEKVPLLGILGLIAGFAGVGLVMWSRLSFGADLFGVILCVLGAFALTIATLSVRGTGSGGNVLMIVGLQMLVGSAALAIAAALIEPFYVTWTPAVTAAFIYTTLVPGLLATWIWFLLVNRVGMVRASTFHFLNPFLGVAIAAIILGERLSSMDIIGALIIAAGIFAVQISKPSKTT